MKKCEIYLKSMDPLFATMTGDNGCGIGLGPDRGATT